VFDSEGTHVASVGADKVLNYWDLRNTKTPLFANKESSNVLMSCAFMPSDTLIVVTSMMGEISLFCTIRQKRIFYHDTLPDLMAIEKENRLPAEA
jgi:WD40 repeat protein